MKIKTLQSVIVIILQFFGTYIILNSDFQPEYQFLGILFLGLLSFTYLTLDLYRKDKL